MKGKKEEKNTRQSNLKQLGRDYAMRGKLKRTHTN